MGRFGAALALWVGGLVLGTTAALAQDDLRDPMRDPTPEAVSFVAGVGFLEPLDRFGDDANGGLLLSIGGLYHLNRWIAPEFALQYGFLDGPTVDGDDTSIDTFRMLGGLRAYLLPADFLVRPWGGILAGWGHYEASPGRDDLRPIFAEHRHDRDDLMLSFGGGLEVHPHPNVTVGGQLRYDHSFTNDGDLGERDLQSMTALGTVAFNY